MTTRNFKGRFTKPQFYIDGIPTMHLARIIKEKIPIIFPFDGNKQQKHISVQISKKN